MEFQRAPKPPPPHPRPLASSPNFYSTEEYFLSEKEVTPKFLMYYKEKKCVSCEKRYQVIQS